LIFFLIIFFRLSLLPASPSHEDSQNYYDLFGVCARQELNWMKHCGYHHVDRVLGADELRELNQCYNNLSIKMKRTSPLDPMCKEGGEFFGLCRPELARPTTDGRPMNCPDRSIFNSIYFLQLIEWLNLFSEDQLFIASSEEFFDNPAAMMNDVCDFLGIGDVPFDWSFIGGNAYNIVNPNSKYGNSKVGTPNHPANPQTLGVGKNDIESVKSKYPPMDPVIRAELNDFFAPFNRLLSRLIGQSLW
jgi:hypothetical protein